MKKGEIKIYLENDNVRPLSRNTKGSSGYDISSNETDIVIIPPPRRGQANIAEFPQEL